MSHLRFGKCWVNAVLYSIARHHVTNGTLWGLPCRKRSSISCSAAAGVFFTATGVNLIGIQPISIVRSMVGGGSNTDDNLHSVEEQTRFSKLDSSSPPPWSLNITEGTQFQIKKNTETETSRVLNFSVYGLMSGNGNHFTQHGSKWTHNNK